MISDKLLGMGYEGFPVGAYAPFDRYKGSIPSGKSIGS